jgi:hypothetical protein
MKKYNVSSRLTVLTSLLVSLAVILAIIFTAQAQKGSDPEPAAQGQGGAAHGTGLISLAPGQAVRLAAVNIGGKTIQGEFLFVPVTEQGKVAVPIRCDLLASPGDASSMKISHPGGANVLQFYAQVRVYQNAKDVEELVPSLQIINEETGRMEQVLSGADFVEIRPIWVP